MKRPVPLAGTGGAAPYRLSCAVDIPDRADPPGIHCKETNNSCGAQPFNPKTS